MAELKRNIFESMKVCNRKLKRFDMLDCKSMATPMDTNMKLLSDETSKLVYMTQYR